MSKRIVWSDQAKTGVRSVLARHTLQQPAAVIAWERICARMAASIAIRRIPKVPLSLGFSLILCLASPGRSLATDQEALKADAEVFFRGSVTPFIKTYCLSCHQNRRPTQAGVNFDPALKAPGHAAFTGQWMKSAARVKAHGMPPKSAPQPSDADRQIIVDWTNSFDSSACFNRWHCSMNASLPSGLPEYVARRILRRSSSPSSTCRLSAQVLPAPDSLQNSMSTSLNAFLFPSCAAALE